MSEPGSTLAFTCLEEPIPVQQSLSLAPDAQKLADLAGLSIKGEAEGKK